MSIISPERSPTGSPEDAPAEDAVALRPALAHSVPADAEEYAAALLVVCCCCVRLLCAVAVAVFVCVVHVPPVSL